jgi:hypothetical protein
MSRRRPSHNLDADGKLVKRNGIDGAIFDRPSPIILPAINPQPPPQQIPIEHLVPALMQQGCQPSLSIGCRPDGMVGLVAQCGPIAIPLAFDLDGLAQIEGAIATAKAQAEGLQPVNDPEIPEGCEDLLQQAMANVDGEAH